MALGQDGFGKLKGRRALNPASYKNIRTYLERTLAGSPLQDLGTVHRESVEKRGAQHRLKINNNPNFGLISP
jgi:hypothetical protein